MPDPICSFAGCEAPLARGASGLCAGHLGQRHRGRPLTPIFRGTEADRFWRDVDKSDGCWNWCGNKNQKGYGRFKIGAVRVSAHRWSYEHLVGPIPEGLTIDHLCRNTSCVRPDHLEAVTNKVNSLRGYGPTAMNARKTHCSMGHEFSGANLATRPDGGRRCRACSNKRSIEGQAKARRAKRALAESA